MGILNFCGLFTQSKTASNVTKMQTSIYIYTHTHTHTHTYTYIHSYTHTYGYIAYIDMVIYSHENP
jgi:hypothetical protein